MEFVKSVDRSEEAKAEVNLGGILAAVMLIATVLLWSGVPSCADNAPRHILILSAYNYTFPAATQVIDGIENRLREKSGRRLEIDAEFLDLVRVEDPQHEVRTATFIREKYAARPPDIVVVVGGTALQFMMKYRDIVAPQVPVVFAGVSQATYSGLRPPANVTGVLIGLDLENTLHLAELLQPAARRLFVIASNITLEDRRWQETARRAIEQHDRKFETTYLFGLPYDVLVGEVSRIPSDAIVILLAFFGDGTNRTLTGREVARELARASPAPLYGPYNTYLDTGVVGGFFETFESHGAAAADLILAIGAGEDPAALQPKINPTQAFYVDSKAMARWGLKQSNLPPGTNVWFKQPSLWEEHHYLISAVALVIALQTIIVAALLVQRRRRRQAESSLEESEDRMTFTAASANIGLWQFDRTTDELWATDHCRTMFGLASDTPLTRERFVAAVHPDDRRIAVGTLRGVLRGQATVTDIRIVRPDGQIRWFRIRARAPLDRGRSPDQLSGILVDITDQKAAESEADQQRQEIAHLMRVSTLGELSGAIAHEVNQPLTAILSNAQAALYILEQSEPNLAEVRDALQDIVKEDSRAGNVVRRLHGLLKKEQTRSEFVDLNEMVDSAQLLLRSELIRRRVTIETDLAKSRPTAYGDSVQLQQVLLNLVINSMDAMASTPVSQRRVRICTRDGPDGAIELSVSDSGCGIRHVDGKQLFKPFYTTKDHGLGLGLTICSSIIRKHGGTLNLRDNEAGGATARITLPPRPMLMAAQ
ncbi:PAS domain-containing protein [Bradyrhizobium liaoningense]|nr:PAS domain-containing protein [Bradyrhizobium liaoningense]